MARKRGKKVLDGLTAEESQDVLRLLLGRHPELVEEAEGLAVEVASGVDREAVAGDLVMSVGLLTLAELSGRAGRQAYGYVEPSEAAWEILEEVVEVFHEDIVRLAGLGLEDGARATCEGVLLGLYRLREDEDHDVLGYAGDFPEEAAGWTLERWRKAKGPEKGRRVLGDGFVEEVVPEWGWLGEGGAGRRR